MRASMEGLEMGQVSTLIVRREVCRKEVGGLLVSGRTEDVMSDS